MVEGVQLAQLTDAEIEEMRTAFATHGVLFLRNQDFPPAEHLRFARRFGDLVINKFFSHDDEFPDIAEVRKDPDQETNLGGGWHTDSPFLPQPPAISLLYATDVPPYGGDTWWANTGLAYRFLSETLREKLDPLRMHMSARNVLATIARNSSDAAVLGKI